MQLPRMSWFASRLSRRPDEAPGPGATGAGAGAAPDGSFAAAVGACTEAQRNTRPLTAVVLEVDGLRAAFRWESSEAVDGQLAAIGASWRPALTTGEVMGRHGECGFALLMPGATSAHAYAVVARLRDLTPTGLSVGIAEALPGEAIEACVRRAEVELAGATTARLAGRIAPQVSAATALHPRGRLTLAASRPSPERLAA